jgi:hypothetical protein
LEIGVKTSARELSAPETGDVWSNVGPPIRQERENKVYFTRTMFLAVICGIASPIVINTIARLLGIWGSNGVYVVAFFVFMLLGGLVANFASMSLVLAGCIALFSIAVGVFIDVTMDFFLRAYDRNLWPFEIMIWWAFAPIPMVLGALFVKAVAATKIGKRANR